MTFRRIVAALALAIVLCASAPWDAAAAVRVIGADTCCPEGEDDRSGEPGAPCARCDCCAVQRVGPPPAPPVMVLEPGFTRLTPGPATHRVIMVDRDIFRPPKLRTA